MLAAYFLHLETLAFLPVTLSVVTSHQTSGGDNRAEGR